MLKCFQQASSLPRIENPTTTTSFNDLDGQAEGATSHRVTTPEGGWGGTDAGGASWSSFPPLPNVVTHPFDETNAHNRANAMHTPRLQPKPPRDTANWTSRNLEDRSRIRQSPPQEMTQGTGSKMISVDWNDAGDDKILDTMLVQLEEVHLQPVTMSEPSRLPVVTDAA